MKNYSFANLGRSYLHRCRDRINRAEDSIDLENQFSLTISDMLSEIFDGEIDVEMNDVALEMADAPHFSLSNRLTGRESFKRAWNNSDLPQMVEKLAVTFAHRMQHLRKHPEKTEKKIRNGHNLM